MKNLKLVMRKVKLHLVITFICCFCVFINGFGQSPTLVQPGSTDNAWYYSSNPIVGVGTAGINYGSGNSIYVSNYYDGSGTEVINIYDPSIGGTASISNTGTIGSIGIDIVIGNWDGVSSCSSCISTATDYIMATSFRNNSGDVEIDYYDVYDDGVSTVSVNALTTETSTTSSGTYNTGWVHLDLIAEAGNTTLTGYPFCNKYVVTWDDAYTHSVYAAANALNNPNNTLTGTQINPSMTTAIQPDVAAIQRNGFGPPRPVHDIALITYSSGNSLFEVEWDYTINSISSPTTLDAGSTSINMGWPRIDALDDYVHNSNPSNSNYKVVAQVLNTSHYFEVRTYDNVLGSSHYTSSNVIDISGVSGFSTYYPPYQEYMQPSVALGPGSNYEVFHYVHIGTNSDIVFMEPINVSSPSTLAGNSYYWVNSNGAPCATVNGAADASANSVSAPVNDIGAGSIFAWALNNGSNYEVDFKTIGSSYAFRHSSAITGTIPDKDLKLYPNPAMDELFISIGTTTYTTSNYSIVDMLGRTMVSGKLPGTVNSIDISSLPPGNYLIKIMDVENNQPLMFVKN